MSDFLRRLFLLPSPLPNDPERKFLTLEPTSRKLLPLCWLPSLASNSESLVGLLIEVVLKVGVEAATKVLAADANDSSI